MSCGFFSIPSPLQGGKPESVLSPFFKVGVLQNFTLRVKMNWKKMLPPMNMWPWIWVQESWLRSWTGSIPKCLAEANQNPLCRETVLILTYGLFFPTMVQYTVRHRVKEHRERRHYEWEPREITKRGTYPWNIGIITRRQLCLQFKEIKGKLEDFARAWKLKSRSSNLKKSK